MTALDLTPMTIPTRACQPGSLADTVSGAVFTFPGIDIEWPRRLAALTTGRPWLQAWVDHVVDAATHRIGRSAAAPAGALHLHLHDQCDPATAATAAHALAGTVLTALTALTALESEGLPIAGTATGHSAGLIAAAAAGGGAHAAADAVAFAFILGVTGTQAARTLDTLPDGARTPMAAVRGPATSTLRALLTEGVEIAMINAPGEHVVSGRPTDLARFERTLSAIQAEQAQTRKRGQRPGAALTVSWEDLPNPLPFHHSHLAVAAERAGDSGIQLRPHLTTIDPATGAPLPRIATTAIAHSVLARTQDWAGTLRRLAPAPFVAVGDNPAVHTLTEKAVAGTGSPVIRTETPAGRRALFVPGADLPTTTNYAQYQPTRQGDRLVTKHTRLTGRSPFILAGMTPTTVDVGIVAAAANAGHVAELAGGGQVSERIFRQRMAELSRTLTPGAEVVFNALHLDPYLWDLHLGGQRLVQRARLQGAPICGVTISAGMPEPQEAADLLDELNDLGIWLNAVKPGDVKGVQAALRIAELTEHPLWLHLEGGQAGGHHSWDDLEQVLLRTYAQIRAHDNVILAVGGGVGTPERATQLLTGAWSERHGQVPMPVDAILIGTAAMACAESTASDSVKRALVAVDGPATGWVRRAHFEAGMTSGLSGLNADIHFVDNSASRAAALLDEVAGDAHAVEQRRDEIIAALARTAKPYFGDLRTMTYRDLLVRFAELTAVGTGDRYQDGVWLDPTHRSRFLDLVHRTEARLHEIDEGPITPLVDEVDDPAQVLRQLAGYPLDSRLHPGDADYFVAVCRRPGKPVPFVPVLDADVRKWYQSDALWQSHDKHYDADQVLIIPGPAAVAGIEQVDEPVASLLGRFEADCLPHAGPATHDPVLTRVLRAPVVRWAGRIRPNPLRRIGEWEITETALWTDGTEYARLVPAGAERVDLEIGWNPLTADDGGLHLGLQLRGSEVTVVGLDVGTATAPDVRWPDHLHAELLDARQVLPDAGMRTLWPEIFAMIHEVAPEGLLDLVHAQHTLRRSTRPDCAVLGTEPTATGFALTTRAGDGRWSSTDTFFVRQPGAAPEGEPVVTEQRPWHDTPVLTYGSITLSAPANLDDFALTTGDLNPIHRSDALARFVGLPGRIVHGMWTSALGQRAAIELACDGDVDRLQEWEVSFLAPVLPGAAVTATVARTGVADGDTRVEVRLDSGDQTVALATATVGAPRTAYVFPGQGIQHVGMGMDGYERSAAAREVWDTADAHCRQALGFSILQVVRENPTSLTAGIPGDAHAGVTYRHRAGVLFLTQFTQVAMATLASAQVAELRERGVFDEHAVTAGHSVGEYNALAAVTGTLALQDLVELVFARGTAMHHLVPRDDHGTSDYRLAVVRPHLADMDHQQTEDLVAGIAQRTGQLCQIVNHNLKGKQYAVAGTVAALQALETTLGAGNGKPPFLLVPGIDVPFHSQALTGGVAEFRTHLQQRLPREIDPQRLVGRYVPNLYPVPFAITREYVSGVRDVCQSPALSELLDTWQAHTAGEITRTLLVELLAWQFAMPVRWIETTDVLCSQLQVRRIVEVGVGAAPTLTNLTKGALALPDHRGTVPQVLNVEADAEVVFAQDAPPVAEDPEPQVATQPVVSEPVATTRVEARVADRPLTHADALRALVAVRVGIRPEQVEGTIEDLVDGASSRRNQLLMDIGKEFGVSGMDGAHEVDLGEVGQALAEKATGYRFPGPVLGAWREADLVSALGRHGLTSGAVAARVTGHWGLGSGWTDRTLMAVGLGVREGTSKRGGPLSVLADRGDDLVDAALSALAADLDIELSPAVAANAVDATAMSQWSERLEDVLAAAATSVLTGLDRMPRDEPPAVAGEDRLQTLDREYGAGHAARVAGVFDARRHVELASAGQWARADVDHLVQGAAVGAADAALIDQIALHRDTDERIAATLRWYAARAHCFGEGADAVREVTAAALARHPRGIAVDIPRCVPDYVAAAARALGEAPGPFADTVALVTGASPGSIALASVAHLLRGSATVVLVTSTDTDERIAAYRDLERRYAGPGAKLHVIRANLASFTDIDDLLEWLTTPATRTVGLSTEQVKPALWPTLVLPFAAGLAAGSLADTGADNEVTVRLMSLGVQRLVGRLGELTHRAGKPAFTAILPLSPNHGTFGGDGSYGETKAALETVLNRWHTEQSAWAAGTRLVGAEIGWVRGTGLMSGNDHVAAHIEQQLGVSTFSAEQMGALIAALTTMPADQPYRVDLTGGLSQATGIAAALRTLPDDASEPPPAARTLDALPAPRWPRQPVALDVRPRISLDDMVVIAGIAEIGPWGSSATRWQAELGDLSADTVTELAWRMGLITWDRDRAQWLDTDGQALDEGGVAAALREVVDARAGVRALHTTADVAASGTVTLREIYLDTPLTVGETTYPAGTAVRVPEARPLQRQVGGQFPTGIDPTRHGVEQGLASGIDPLAAWNLVVTAEALAAAGVTPEQLREAVHPSRIGNVQGTGMGGMNSLHKLYVDPLLGTSHANDLLQEALGNVVSAHVNQSLIGGYGPMVHPVAACATAAVSLEEAVDKIRLGKADILVGGGFDDLSSEGINGFADMAATADNAQLLAAGIPGRRHSRPGDRRRAGFVESQGGGSFLVMRASVALRLGVPVRAVVAYAGSFGDGVQTSIPAPGLGTLAAARGGSQSPLATALAAHGLGADDITVVSKHDTSTLANDPNEALIHATVQRSLGRSEGAPLRVISQKSVTGHAKGGAAAWQLAGLCDVFSTDTVPGNQSLVCVDQRVTRGPLVVDYRPLHRAEPVRAALLTSLGFGHVSALVALAHPGVFLAALTPEHREEYLRRSAGRSLDGAWRLLAARHGGEPVFRRRTERPDQHREIDDLMGALR